MAKPRRRLGRGLDSLISDLRTYEKPPDESRKSPVQSREPSESLPAGSPGKWHKAGHPGVESDDSDASEPGVQAAMVPTGHLNPNPFQPRGTISDADILSLARSIRRSGFIQPITVRPRAGRYEIIAGERRWRAATHLGLHEVPVMIRDAGDDQMLEFALIENIQREDLGPLERAQGYRRLRDEFDLRPEDIARRLGEDRTTVTNYLRLLDLPAHVQSLVAAGRLTMGHARCLAGVADEPQLDDLVAITTKRGLSVRALESLVRRTRGDQRDTAPAQRDIGQAHVRDMERRFEEAVKMKVTVQVGKRKGTGRIVIEYASLDDFDRISSLLGVHPE